MTSMLQSYVNNLQHRQNDLSASQQMQRQNALRTGVKAYKPLGHIVRNESPFSITAALRNDKDAIKYFFNGIQGKGNDYSTGRINDTAIKLSGLGIAGIIATTQGSPFRKGMEFIGLACWLGAMSLWPKLAINMPLKYMKGVDLDAQYVSAKGQKKPFYTDPQYICWDMLSDEEIAKMGDKMGIPRNIYNRRKAVENKARQIAVQGNTLALLTAGFSTPLIASLAADKLGKHAFYPLITKAVEAKASSLQAKMGSYTAELLSDNNFDNFIEQEVQEIITPQTRANIKQHFEKLTGDTSLSKVINNTVDEIFKGKNISEMTVTFDKALEQKVAQIYLGENNITPEIKQKISDLVKTFNDTVNPQNKSAFVAKLNALMLETDLIDAEQAQNAKKEVIKLLNSSSSIKLSNPQNTREKLKKLSGLLITYDKRIHMDFNTRFYNYAWNGAVSTNADIWEKMPLEIFKALQVDKKTLKALANAQSAETANEVLHSFMNEIISSPEKYNSVITSLGKTAEKLSQRNEKYLKFSLEYLDKMEKLLTSINKSGEFNELSNVLASMFATKRKEIIGKYASANNTMFAPIRILNSMRIAQNNPNYTRITRALFDSQTVDAFINRLDHMKDIIRNEAQYRQVVDIMFANLSEETKNNLPKELVEKIDDTSTMMKYLFGTQSDGVKIKYSMNDTSAITEIMKKMNLYKYMDDMYSINFNSPESILNRIKQIIQTAPEKIDELKTFLKLSDSEITEIRSGMYSALDDNFKGCTAGKGYIENGRNRFKVLLGFLSETDFSNLGNFTINKAQIGKTSEMQGCTFAGFMKGSAEKIFSYNGWFKKVGLAFVGLCAITAVAILRTGKKNEFNPDKYQKRSV